MANIKPAKLGTFFAMLTILYAFSMGAGMGLFEKEAKQFLKDEALAVQDTVYLLKDAKAETQPAADQKAAPGKIDEVKMKATTEKAWKYVKRSHEHAGGIGAVALAMCLMLGIVSRCGICKFLGSLCLGLGGLAYAVFWGLAAWKAPTLGSTGAAKEMFEYVAMGGGGMCLFGLLLAFMAFFKGCCGSGCSTYDE
jgi:hypothetical protein